jgi:putative sigma-54 modulation protein
MKPNKNTPSFSDDIGSKILMQGIHLDLTEALQNAIRDKFSVLLRHNPYIIRINVRLDLNQTRGQTHLYRASAQVEIGGPDLNASADAPDAYDVLDLLVAKLSKLIERRHGLRKDRRNHPHEIELAAAIPKASAATDARAVENG